MPEGPLLEVREVVRSFRRMPRGFLRRRPAIVAVDRVSLVLERGEAFGLVGASGSGKTTLGRVIAGLDAPDSGEVRLDGEVVRPGSLSERRALWRRVQYVHQNPRGALNPRRRVGEIVGGPLASLRGVAPDERRQRVRRALERVALEPDAADRYPHAFSGGQAQRIAIARAISVEPELLVLDEPTSALDVRVQAALIALLAELRAELGTALLFVSHDLAVVASLCDRVGVLESGRLVEQGPRTRVFQHPEHGVTRRLLESVPRLVPVRVGG